MYIVTAKENIIHSAQLLACNNHFTLDDKYKIPCCRFSASLPLMSRKQYHHEWATTPLINNDRIVVMITPII